MVPMAELRKFLETLGFKGVKTLLQSGNAVFLAPKTPREALEKAIESGAEASLGVQFLTFVRTAEELRETVQNNPFPEAASNDPSHLLAVFLKAPPDQQEVKKVQSAVKGRETIAAGSDHLYVYYPDGIGDSKLAATPGWKALGGSGTGRNWNTVLKLTALTAELR